MMRCKHGFIDGVDCLDCEVNAEDETTYETVQNAIRGLTIVRRVSKLKQKGIWQ